MVDQSSRIVDIVVSQKSTAVLDVTHARGTKVLVLTSSHVGSKSSGWRCRNERREAGSKGFGVEERLCRSGVAWK